MTFSLVMTGYDSSVFHPQSGSDTRTRIESYAAELRKQYPNGHLTYFCLRAPNEAKKISLDGLDFIPVHGNALTAPLAFIYKIRRMATLTPPALIVTQTPYEDGITGYIAAKLTGSTFAVQVHNDLAHTPGPPVIRWLRWLCANFTIARANMVRVVNPVALIELQKRYPAQSIILLPVPVTLAAQTRTHLPDTPTILTVARLSPEKGVDLALQVMQDVQQRIPQARMIIVGDGPERSKLEALSKNLGIHATFTGNIPNAQLSAYYQAASVFLLTSRQESYGRVLLEAMLHALPIVASDTLGARTLLTGPLSTYIMQQNDISGTAAILCDLLANQDHNLAAAALAQKAADGYTPAHIIENMIRTLLHTAKGMRCK